MSSACFNRSSRPAQYIDRELSMTAHFYTTDANERQKAINNLGFAAEGISCYVFSAPAGGSAPLYRAFHPATGSHFYTMSLAERDKAVNHFGYTAEGIACYIDAAQQAGTIPLYRAYQAANDDHFYTTDLAEHNNAVQHLGYDDEGITGYVYANLLPGAVPFYRLYGPNVVRSLNFVEQPQQQTNWCWAATSVSVARYYDPANTWTQCLLVNDALAQTTCCQNGATRPCNQSWYGDRALTIVGHLASTGGASTFAIVQSEINALRPISIAIYWFGDGGHNPLIDGYSAASVSPTIDIQDPWYGHSTQDFNSFPASYNGGAIWGASFFTR
jgi:Repeat of unknown function (DUF5648)/Papain-like cysteine protease AvrRpt2